MSASNKILSNGNFLSKCAIFVCAGFVSLCAPSAFWAQDYCGDLDSGDFVYKNPNAPPKGGCNKYGICDYLPVLSVIPVATV